MRDCDVGEVRIDDLYNLVVVISQLLKLEIKVIQTGNKLHFRRVASDNYELLVEDSFDNKPAAVMLRSGLAEQFVEADILLFIEPERVLITRSFRLPGISVCLFTIGIHNIGSKGVRLGRTPGLAERAPLSDKTQFVGQRYSSLPSGDGKNPLRRNSDGSFSKSSKRSLEPVPFPMQCYSGFSSCESLVSGHKRTGRDIRIIPYKRGSILVRAIIHAFVRALVNDGMSSIEHACIRCFSNAILQAFVHEHLNV